MSFWFDSSQDPCTSAPDRTFIAKQEVGQITMQCGVRILVLTVFEKKKGLREGSGGTVWYSGVLTGAGALCGIVLTGAGCTVWYSVDRSWGHCVV